MNHRSTFLTAAVTVLLLAAGAEAKEGRRPDSWITTKVKSSLAAHKNVSGIGTKVETKDGIVILRGEAKTEAEKELAAKYASQIEGVRGVDNHIIVKGEEGGSGLTPRVKAALAANPATSAFRTNVDSKDGKVTLRGTAKSEEERDLAEEVARGVDGVLDVENRIEVKP